MKHFFDLQLFAEAEAPVGEIAGEEPKGAPEAASEQSGASEEKKYTDADLDSIISRKFAELTAKAERKARAKDEAQRLASMTEAERQNQEREQLQRQVQELLQKERRSEMAKTARAMLKDKQISVDDDLLGMLISDDADTTKASIESFTTLFQSAVQSAVKDALKGTTPKAGGASTLTKEEILGVKNRAERQRLIKENMHLFK